MNLRKEKGAIAIFVLVALLFMSSFLIILYASNVNKSKVVKEQFDIISRIYSHSGGDEGAYDKAYTDLRKKNKQTMTASVEDKSKIELTKTFDEPMSNYRIYGKGVKAETNYTEKFTVVPTNPGFIEMSGTYPTTNPTYPNATYTVIDIKAGQTFNFNFSATETSGNYGLRIRCIDAETNNAVTDLVNDNGEKEELWKEYCDATIYYGFTKKENGYVKAKKDFKIGIMYIVNKPADFSLEITRELSGLPSEYQQVEYIESTGTQYLITNIYPQFDWKFELKFSNFILTSSSQPPTFFSTEKNEANYYYALNRNTFNFTNITDSFTLGLTNSSNIDNIYFDGTTISYNNEAKKTFTSSDHTALYKLVLFRNRLDATGTSQRYASFRLYSFKMFNEYNTVYDLVPCYRISDSKAGMYDVVNGVFYQNAATTGDDFTKGPNVGEKVGDFISDTSDANYGKYKIPIKLTNEKGESITKDIILNEPLYDGDYIDFKAKKLVRSNGTEESIDLPEISTFEDYTKIEVLTATVPSKIEVEYLGYTISDNDSNIIPGFTKLEYIESTGTQYINTGFNLKLTSKIDISLSITAFTTTSTRAGMLGSYATDALFQLYESSKQEFTASFGGNTYKVLEKINLNEKYNIHMENATIKINDNSYDLDTGTKDSEIPMYLFYRNNVGEKAKMKLFSAQIYDNDVLVRNFVPVKRQEDGIVGFYDLVEGKFYTNSGTGNFVAGPEV